MGNYEQLKEAIKAVIKTNGKQEITGQVMQDTLLAITSSFGQGALFAGIATPETNPLTPDQNVFYLASQSGVYPNFNGLSVADGEIVVFSLSNGQWTKQILSLGGGGSVTIINEPDEEDLTTVPQSAEKNVIRFKNRIYDEANASGKGYKILRKYWKEVNGVRKNILTQDMINDANTVYEIRYDFDLNGAEISIPKNCILRFRGGSLRNGTLILDQTVIDATLYQIFYNITTKGYSSSDCQVEWFGAKAYNKLDTEFTYSSDAIQNALDSCFNNVYFNVGVYYIDKTLEMDCKKTLTFKGSYNGQIKTLYNYEINNINASTLCVLTDIDILHINCRYNTVPNDINGFISINGFGILDATKVDNYNSIAVKINVNGVIITNSNIDLYIINNFRIATIEEAESESFGNSIGIELNNSSTASYSIYGIKINGMIKGFRYGVKNNMPKICYPTNFTFNCEINSCVTAIDFGVSGIEGSSVFGNIQCAPFFTQKNVNKYPIFIGSINKVFFNSYVWDLNLESKGILFHKNTMILNYKTDFPLFGEQFKQFIYNANGDVRSMNYGYKFLDIINPYVAFNKNGGYFIDFLTNDYLFHQDYIIEENGFDIVGSPFGENVYQLPMRITPKEADNNKSFKVKMNIIPQISLCKTFIEYNEAMESYFESVDVVYKDKNNIELEKHSYLFNIAQDGDFSFISDLNVKYGSEMSYVEFIFNNFKFNSNTIISFGIKCMGFRHLYKHINTINKTEIQKGGTFVLQGDEFQNVTTDAESYLLNANNKGRIYSTAGRHRFFSDSEILSEIQNSPSAYGSGCRFYMYNYEEPKTFIYDKQVNKLYRINMVDNDFKERGAFAERPSNPYIGYQFFCTDKQTTEGALNGIVIYYKGNNVWVDALGRVVN